VTGFIACSWAMFKSVIRSFVIVCEKKPDVVIGFGGYGAFPVVVAAWMRGIPTMIHEQNVVPGKANKVLAKVARKIAISFKDSKQYFPIQKTVLTGCPPYAEDIEETREELFMKFSLEKNRFTVLVIGGSQGSHHINVELIKAIKALEGVVPLQVIHLCGKRDYDLLKEEYRHLEIPFCLYDFLDEMGEAYKVADLIISRAGALTITEIIMARVPAILVPYPYAGTHQLENARVLENAQAARIIQDRDLTVDTLSSAIKDFYQQKMDKEELEKRVQSLLYPQAALHLCQEAVALVQ